MAETQEEILAGMWAAHRESVWRLLLALARDMDLADDLLQDTYLRAREGFSAYRNGDARAWLAAIARNVYYSHARQRRVRAEVISPHPEQVEAASPPVDLVALLAVRQALAALPAAFRTALVMKHYAGYTYQEIARHQSCPVGTAKWRVSEALSRLRLALGSERSETMAECAEVHEFGLADYVYGLLPKEEAERVREHLAGCEGCRKEADELGKVVALLEAMEGERKQMHFIELGSGGEMTAYNTFDCINDMAARLETVEFQSDVLPGRLYQEGEELPLVPAPNEQYGDRNYQTTLRRPVPMGARLSLLSVLSCQPGDQLAPVELEEGRFRYLWKHSPSSNMEFAYIAAMRLPSGAKMLSADLEPDETRQEGGTTLIWRRVLPAGQVFECTVEYQVEAP